MIGGGPKETGLETRILITVNFEHFGGCIQMMDEVTIHEILEIITENLEEEINTYGT